MFFVEYTISIPPGEPVTKRTGQGSEDVETATAMAQVMGLLTNPKISSVKIVELVWKPVRRLK